MHTSSRKPKIDQDWTPEELSLLQEHYCKPDGPRLLQQLLPHRGYNSIKGMANVKGLKRRPVFTKNKLFFRQGSENSHMLSGFIAADGCITGQKYDRLNITLSIKDQDHLHAIKDLLEYSGEIYTYQPKLRTMIDKRSGKEYLIGKDPHCTLQIGQCDEWIADLKQTWNITPRKSHTLQPPNLTNLCHILCYLSGLIDGDGWVCLNKKADSKHGKVLEISVMGTKELMTWVKRVFDYITPGQTQADIKSTSSPNGAVYTVRGTRAYLLSKVFLSLDILRLERKWQAAREYGKLLEETGGFTPKMQRWIALSGFDFGLINRLQTEEIVLPDVPNA